MGVDGNGVPAKSGVEHDICGLAPDTGKTFQSLTIFRHLAVVLVDENLAGLPEMAGLRLVKPNGPYAGNKPLFSKA